MLLTHPLLFPIPSHPFSPSQPPFLHNPPTLPPLHISSILPKISSFSQIYKILLSSKCSNSNNHLDRINSKYVLFQSFLFNAFSVALKKIIFGALLVKLLELMPLQSYSLLYCNVFNIIVWN